MDTELEKSIALLREFKNNFPDKFHVEEDDLLGFGYYGAVFKGRDLHRGLDVAIKIYHDGIAPIGSERGWAISSLANHYQIAHTYSIERYKTSLGKNCIAAIARLVPGKSLKHIWDCYESLNDSEKEIITEDFVYSLVPSLISITEFCHKLKYGHGDLNSGNVMVFIEDINKRYEFTAILIDFDNATIKDDLAYESEVEKIAADYPKLRTLIAGTLSDWRFKDATIVLFDELANVQNFKIGYSKVLSFIKIIENPHCTTNLILQFLITLLPLELPKTVLKPIIDCLQKMAMIKGKSLEFKLALEDFDIEYQKYEELADLRMELTFIEHSEMKAQIYTKMFE